MFEIAFYRKGGGGSPVEEFIDSLPIKKAQKVLWVLRLIQELDRVPESYFKKLKSANDIWEVRISQGGDAYRLLGFVAAGQFIVLTNGFSKKTQKTPIREIELATERKKDYIMRKQT